MLFGWKYLHCFVSNFETKLKLHIAMKVDKMEKLFKETLPQSGDPISVDRILADLSHTKSPPKGIVAKNDPPAIFYSTNPSILLIVLSQSKQITSKLIKVLTFPKCTLL